MHPPIVLNPPLDKEVVSKNLCHRAFFLKMLPALTGSLRETIEKIQLRTQQNNAIIASKDETIFIKTDSKLIQDTAQNFNAESINQGYHKPDAKKEVKLVKADEVDKLIDLLENEAKVI